MPGRSNARERRGNDASRRGTLADSHGRTPAIRPGASSDYRAARRADRDARFAPPGRLTLPSTPIARPSDAWDADDYAGVGYGEPDRDDWDDGYGERAGWGDEDEGGYVTVTGRQRSSSLARPLASARPLAPAPVEDARREASNPRLAVFPALPQESVPELAAYRPPRPRVRRATERLVETARNPWTKARLALALVATLIGFMFAPGRMGEPPQPLQVAQAQVGLSAGSAITSLVRPETQLKRPDLYDNYSQFLQWGGAACSAAAISEVLTAYGIRGASIGREIDELGSYISPNWGLLNRHAFAIIAATHGLRADESTSWTYNQIVYVSQHLGIPVIVNVRISYGYYSFFSGGHFLVVVGGDSQGLAIVDSSEYYIHYLPRDVFYQMFTGYTAAIAPGDDQYSLPAN